MSNQDIAAASLAAIAIAVLGVFEPEIAVRAADQRKPGQQMAAPAMTNAMAGPAADLIGSGCARLRRAAPERPGLGGRNGARPGRAAASNNPLLSTLTAALSGKLNPNVNLVDTLNSGQYTVFAPTNAAFDKLPPATLDELKTNADMLKSILTYHVVQGQESPDTVDGTHKTLQGADVKVAGQGNGPQGQRRRPGVRRGAHRQRDGVHDRHCADATQPVTAYNVAQIRQPGPPGCLASGWPVATRRRTQSAAAVVANSHSCCLSR